ncbi:MAG: hypothetical protein ABI551_06535, partial [Polyangiaceae bacterium]
MSDDKKVSDDEFDWDTALSEWEQGSFEPEVAKDKETQRPAVLESTTSAAPYKPPPLKVPNLQPSGTPAEGDHTKVGTIPRALRGGVKPPAVSTRPGGHGGLGQLFGKTDGTETKAAPPPLPRPKGAPPAAPPAPVRRELKTLSTETDDALLDAMLDGPDPHPPSEHPSIVTSAELPKLSSLLPEEPLKRPPPRAEEEIAEGEMFDPFVDPESKKAEKRDSTPTAPPPPIKS